LTIILKNITGGIAEDTPQIVKGIGMKLRFLQKFVVNLGRSKMSIEQKLCVWKQVANTCINGRKPTGRLEYCLNQCEGNGIKEDGKECYLYQRIHKKQPYS